MEAKKAELSTYLLKSKGILNPADQEAEIAKMAQACPAATAADKGLTTDIDKAYEVMLIQQGNTEVAPTATSAAVSTQPTPAISAKEELQISKTLLSQQQDRASVSANSSIEALVLDRPDPADIIPAGTKGTVVAKGWESIMAKIENGTYTVMADDGEEVDADKRIASTTNFNAIKTAVANNTPIDVHIGTLNKKPIGYIVNKGSAVGAGTTPVQMTRATLEEFMIMDTAGYILASETKPGAKLRYVKPTSDPTNPGKSRGGKTILADANKKAAIEAGSFEVSKEKTADMETTTCKSALQFRVVEAGKFKADGTTPLTRTIRVSLKADLPVLVRKAKFLDVFGTGQRDSNGDLMAVPTGDQAKKITEAQRNAIAALRAKAQDPMQLGDLANIADKLAAFDAPATQAPGAVL